LGCVTTKVYLVNIPFWDYPKIGLLYLTYT
jgi:hypothetical protein